MFSTNLYQQHSNLTLLPFRFSLHGSYKSYVFFVHVCVYVQNDATVNESSEDRMCVCDFSRVCVCVCVWRQQSVCVCVCVTSAECVYVWIQQSVFVLVWLQQCVCVWLQQRVCVCVCVCAIVNESSETLKTPWKQNRIHMWLGWHEPYLTTNVRVWHQYSVCVTSVECVCVTSVVFVCDVSSVCVCVTSVECMCVWRQ